MKNHFIVGFILIAMALSLGACGEGSTQTEKAEETIAETTEKEIESNLGEDADKEITELDNDSIIDEPLKGRGKGAGSTGINEPDYENLIGYVALEPDSKVARSGELIVNTPWEIPFYEEDGQDFIEGGTIEHKSEVVVLKQDLKYNGNRYYKGKLWVESLDDGSQYIIDVDNFVTEPYWDLDDLGEAADQGDFIAEYHQVSDYYPVNTKNDKVEVDDGEIVLVVGKTDMKSTTSTPIEAIVYDWENEHDYRGTSIFFNPDDLTLIY